MAKVSPKLWKSSRWNWSLAVAAWALTPSNHMLLAGGNGPIAVYSPSHSGSSTYAQGSAPHFDVSCEPSFRGGDCRNCCLDLWQDYCSQRIDCHCNPYGLRGLGFGLGHGLLGHGACYSSTHSSGQCACEGHCGVNAVSAPASAVQPQVPSSSEGPAQDSTGKSWSNESNGLQPSADPLPKNTLPVPPEPSALHAHAPRVRTAQSTVPATTESVAVTEVEPLRVITTAARPNRGTMRLLQQLNSN